MESKTQVVRIAMRVSDDGEWWHGYCAIGAKAAAISGDTLDLLATSDYTGIMGNDAR